MFAAFQEAGPKIAAILSVMETCKRLQINLRKYLNDVLPKLPFWPINKLRAYWQASASFADLGSPRPSASPAAPLHA
ncbi:MAG: transposase domain-containing protein, partial [Terrimicrobiaceae bacterium]